MRAQTVARGNEEREFSERFRHPREAAERRPMAPHPTPAPLRAASAGALTLTPRYENPLIQLGALVARGKESREARAYEAPAGGGGTTPNGTAPNPGTAARCFRGCASLTTRYENPN
ncbi:MAG TPA: hypothetical protein ENI10_18100 [Halomonas sp.]|nr:hypothetical protein [Halomonas sp.]HDZ49538.1 hypothetical protein [Halomonas sp.]HEB06479.1 hypothetical protein [Halomonas sp.]